jgi:hypothetical protein
MDLAQDGHIFDAVVVSEDEADAHANVAAAPSSPSPTIVIVD